MIESVRHMCQLMKVQFSRTEVFKRFQMHIFCYLIYLGSRKTISNLLRGSGRDQQGWNPDYRLYSNAQWDLEGCQKVLLECALALLPSSRDTIDLNIDLTSSRKVGTKIPNTGFQIDPASPKFKPGLMWGMRYAHIALSVPGDLESSPTRSIPLAIKVCAAVKKPGKRACPERIEAYKKARKEHNANTYCLQMMSELFTMIQQIQPNKRVRFNGDGGYCNKTIFQGLPEGVDFTARCRWDAKLCHKSVEPGHRFYSQEKFTPREVRQDSNCPYRETKIFYGGKLRTVKFKEVAEVYSQRIARRRPLRLIVIACQPYKCKTSGKINYREAVQVLTTDLKSSPTSIIRGYFGRNEIEQNHRDMKSELGFGDAQIRNPSSCNRQPFVVMMAYSMLLITTIHKWGMGLPDEISNVALSKWERRRGRPSVKTMGKLLIADMRANPQYLQEIGFPKDWKPPSVVLAA